MHKYRWDLSNEQGTIKKEPEDFSSGSFYLGDMIERKVGVALRITLS